MIYIPKLIIPKGKINYINSFSTDRKLYLSQIQNRAKSNKNLYSTKRMEQLFLQNEDLKKINEVLNIDNDKTYFIINKKKFINEFNLLERLGIFKLNSDKITKKISVGILDSKDNVKNKSQDFTIKNMRSNLINYKNIRLKYYEKDFSSMDINNGINQNSSSLIINKNFFNDKDYKKGINKKNNNEMGNLYKNLKFKEVNNNIKKLNKEFKIINNKMNDCIFKAKQSFENDIKREFSDYK